LLLQRKYKVRGTGERQGVGLIDQGGRMERRAKVELFEQIRREYEFGVGPN